MNFDWRIAAGIVALIVAGVAIYYVFANITSLVMIGAGMVVGGLIVFFFMKNRNQV
jgi:uncharacterized membrane protein HdeD (DUF308 family)